jgi:DNA-binding NarL/FixJ family response regulator
VAEYGGPGFGAIRQGHRFGLPAVTARLPAGPAEISLPKRARNGDQMGITVVLVDQERTFADALAARLETEPDICVLAAVQAKTRAQCGGIGRHADVMVADADLPGVTANQLCEVLTGHSATPRVIMLSTRSEPTRILSALEAGAVAWVRKDDSLEHLLAVIRGVARGEAWLPPAEMAEVLHLLLRRRDEQRNTDRLLALLTPREREVLICLAEGAKRQEVAERLHLSANTVRTHLQNLMAKLGVHSSLEAVALTRSRLAPRPDAAESGTEDAV